MFSRLCAAAFFGLTLIESGVAAPIRFDFGNGAVSSDTGVVANVVIADGTPLGTETGTVSGVTITLTGVASPQVGSTWGTTANGIGVITSGQGGAANVQPRIDNSIGESVRFSFDEDVTINSIRLGNMMRTGAGIEEVVRIAFVSGQDPFGGGASYTFSTGPLTLTGPTDDIPVGVFVQAGTVLSLTASVPQNNGVLWNDIVVTPIPEPAAIATFALAAVAFAVSRPRRKLR